MRKISLWSALALTSLLASTQLFAASNPDNETQRDKLLIGDLGSLTEKSVGKTLSPRTTIGNEVVRLAGDPETQDYRMRASLSSCHFYSNQLKQNGKLSSGIGNDVNIALQSAYEEDCQHAVIHVYHAVVDKITRGDLRRARISPDVMEEIGDIEISPANTERLVEFRKSVGEHFIKNVYSGFLGALTIEFSFESREDIQKMQTVFAENDDVLQVTQSGEGQLGGDEDIVSGDVQQRINSLSAQMARKSIRGAWRIVAYTIGELAGGTEDFPFVQTDFNALTGNYETILKQIARFNQWISTISKNPQVEISLPILVDVGSIREIRSVYQTPIPGLIHNEQAASLATADIQIRRLFRDVMLARSSFLDSVRDSKRSGKEERLINLLTGEAQDHLRYLSQNMVALDTSGANVLHWAAIYDLPELARVIIDMDPSGEILDSKDKDGRTPLMRAARNGCINTASLLVDEGASLDHVDQSGKSAYTYATTTSPTGTNQVVCVGLCLGCAAALPFAGAAAGALGAAGAVGAAEGVAAAGAFAGAAGEIAVQGQRLFHPDLLCDHVFSCGHSQIAELLRSRGVDVSLAANSWNSANTVCNAVTSPYRYSMKALRYAGKFGKVDNDRS